MKRLLLLPLLFLFATSAWAAIPVVRSPPGTQTTTADTDLVVCHNTTLAGDILLLFVETDDQTATISGGTETWVEIADSPQSVSSETRLTAFWARATVDWATIDEGQLAVTTSDHIISTCISISGALGSGEQIVPAMAADLPDANDSTSFSSPANSDLSSVAEVSDNCKNSGNGGCIFVIEGGLATFGTYGATTLTLEDAAQKAFMTIAIKEVVASTRRVFTVN